MKAALLDYGWEICDDILVPVSTRDDIAPEHLITLVSCNCKGACSTNHCTCKKNNFACTDFCGCGDSCENSDMRPENVCKIKNKMNNQKPKKKWKEKRSMMKKMREKRAKKMKRKSDFIVINHFMLNLSFIDDSI